MIDLPPRRAAATYFRADLVPSEKAQRIFALGGRRAHSKFKGIARCHTDLMVWWQI